MSELKAYMYDDMIDGDADTNIEYYPKSEADKVIAELKDKANYYKCEYKLKSEELADTCRFYEEELRHHKYKRCMAMANRSKAGMYLSYECDFKREWWNKWQKRWLALAEQFKEAK